MTDQNCNCLHGCQTGKTSLKQGGKVDYTSYLPLVLLTGHICDSCSYDATSLFNWIEEFMQKGSTIERGSGIPIFKVIFRTVFKDILIHPNVRIDINSSEAHLLFKRFLFVLLSNEFRTIGPDATLQNTCHDLDFIPERNLANNTSRTSFQMQKSSQQYQIGVTRRQHYGIRKLSKRINFYQCVLR